jgi:hypothetical protein
MKRRSFLAMLGLAPMSVAAARPAHEGSLRVTVPDTPLTRDNGCAIDLNELADEVKRLTDWIGDTTEAYKDAISAAVGPRST